MAYTLHSFHFSNYCEKARWTLDHLGVPHRVQIHYPGPHAGPMRKLSGQTAVPVLQDGETAVAGSAEIAAHFAPHAKYTSLMPAEHAEEVLAWQERIDEAGSMLRNVFFHDLLPDRALSVRVLTNNHKQPYLSPYGLLFQMLIPMLRKMVKKNMPDVAAGEAQCKAMMDEIAATAGPEGYLVGNRFTLADLTAASMFFPVALPEGAAGSDFAKATPKLANWNARWDGHPMQTYIRRMYRDHRAGN